MAHFTPMPYDSAMIPVGRGLTYRRIRMAWMGVFCLSLVSCPISFAGDPGNPVDSTIHRPVLFFTNPDMQQLLGRTFSDALVNLLDTNTVPFDKAVYNQTGLLTDPPGEFIRAGGGYSQPWTRDASLNSWNAASLLEPAVARNTLWSVVRRQPDGTLVIQQDNQWWDKVVWICAAWNHYAITGDREFLVAAYETAGESLREMTRLHYNRSYHLFEGPSFFNDGIAAYPVPPATANEDKGSFVLSYPGTDKLMALSTNALYYLAYRSTARMGATLGKGGNEVASFAAIADTLRREINRHFWIPANGLYGYFIHQGDSLAGKLDSSEEGAGLSFAILFGIADSLAARSIVQKAHIAPHGIVDVYPSFARYSETNPGRHNEIIWPMVQGFWVEATARLDAESAFAEGLTSFARLVRSSGGDFYEIYNAGSGDVDGGWQTGKHWDSQPHQTWSATAYLRSVFSGLFGMRFSPEGVEFHPLLPFGWGDVELSGLRYRNMMLTIVLRGSGHVVSSFSLDGQEERRAEVPASLAGDHRLVITMSEGASR
ncbi:MAG: hypothetical protein WB699_18670 [Bacteroidota bacterium]